MRKLQIIIAGAAIVASMMPRATHAEPIDQHFNEPHNGNGIGDDDAPSKPFELHIGGRDTGVAVTRPAVLRPTASRASQVARADWRDGAERAVQRIWILLVRSR